MSLLAFFGTNNLFAAHSVLPVIKSYQ